MKNEEYLDRAFKKFTRNLERHVPEGITLVDLEFLHAAHLLRFSQSHFEENFTYYFHVIENEDKITLVNDQFVVWIVPDILQGEAITYTLIAIKQGKSLKLETVYATHGIYNTSRIVLKILEKYLNDIQETEDLLAGLEGSWKEQKGV